METKNFLKNMQKHNDIFYQLFKHPMEAAIVKSPGLRWKNLGRTK